MRLRRSNGRTSPAVGERAVRGGEGAPNGAGRADVLNVVDGVRAWVSDGESLATADGMHAANGAAPEHARADAAPALAAPARDLHDSGSATTRPCRAAAFFDLDKTLMAGSSGIFFARAAYESGMISRARLAHDAYENLRFRLRGSTDDRADAVRRRVGEMIAGVPVSDLRRLSPRVLAGVLPRLYPQMLERAYAHQDDGYAVYILTAASQEMADLLAYVLSFDGGLGSRSEVVDGRYTGRPDGPFNYREGKVHAMRELALREGIDLGASFAYSDSESDLPMLSVVGHPIVVNPDADLRAIAAREGWEVIHLDRLPRLLKLAGGLAALAGAGAVGWAARLHVRARSFTRP
jgi:HAD superfamily hydrolase (TIGR01490 family)